MSYFMKITGDISNVSEIDGIKLVLGNDAQEYIDKIIKQFPLNESIKTFLVDDGSWTSHNLILETEESLKSGHPFEQTRLAKLLDVCFKSNCKVRIWWANNDPDAFKKVEHYDDKKIFIKMLKDRLKEGKEVYMLYEPTAK